VWDGSFSGLNSFGEAVVHKIKFMSSIIVAALATICCSSVQANTVNLLTNGNFTGGTYTSTGQADFGSGLQTFTNNVPNGWTSTPGYLYPAYNSTGPGYVVLGNNAFDPIAGISQSFTNTVGREYLVTFDLSGEGGSSGWFFAALMDGKTQLNISPLTPGGYTSQFSFEVIGTGSDTLTLEGANNVRSYTLSNVSVTPLPSGLPLFATGLVALGFIAWHNKRKRQAA
jgi:hypothetical protein